MTEIKQLDNKFNTGWTILKITCGLLLIIVGLDKFLNIMVNWEMYLSPIIGNLLPSPFLPARLMMVVGTAEIMFGLLILVGYIRLGAYLISLWLLIVAINLIVIGFFDVALLDLVIAFLAFALARLTEYRTALLIQTKISS